MMTPVDIPGYWSSQLDAGLAQMGLSLGAAQRNGLLGYLALMRHWNRAFNLTAVRDPDTLVRRHLLDSLSILSRVDDGPVLDVGSGAGLPGIPLAIAQPQRRFSLLDSNSKKTRFLQQVAGELGLSNVEVLRCRAESLGRTAHYARITSRAFATLADMVGATSGLLAPGGRWLAMKGVDPRDELRALPVGFGHEVIPLRVPGERAQRHLVVLWQEPVGSV